MTVDSLTQLVVQGGAFGVLVLINVLAVLRGIPWAIARYEELSKANAAALAGALADFRREGAEQRGHDTEERRLTRQMVERLAAVVEQLADTNGKTAAAVEHLCDRLTAVEAAVTACPLKHSAPR